MLKMAERTLQLALVALAVGTGIALPKAAEAKCAAPGMAATLSSGATVPAKGVVYVFAHRSKRSDRIEIRQGRTWIDAKAARLAVPVATGGDLVGWQVAYPATSGDLELRLGGNKHQVGTVYVYKVSPASPSQRPKAGKHSFVHWSREKNDWTCSHTDLINLRLSGAAVAYRVKISGQEFHLPPSMDILWGRPPSPTVNIGHANCFGETTLPDAGPGRAGPIESVTAIEATGLEVAIALPHRIPQ